MSIQERVIQGSLIALGSALCFAAGWSARSYSANRSAKKHIDQLSSRDQEIEVLLKTLEIEAGKAQAITKDLAKKARLSASELKKVLQQHKLSTKQTEAIINHLYPRAPVIYAMAGNAG